MNRNLRTGIYALLLIMGFSLAGCSAANDANKEELPANEKTITPASPAPVAVLDKQTGLIQKAFGEELKYRGKKSIKNVSDELLVFYGDSAKGFDSLTYLLNARTGTVSDGTSGMPLLNLSIPSPNLSSLNIQSYIAAVESAVKPILTGKGYDYDGKLEDHFNGFIGDGYIEYEVYKNEVLHTVQVEPFIQEVRDIGEVPTSAADAGEAEEWTADPQEKVQTLEELIAQGFTVIEEQSFDVSMGQWENVRFVSGYYMEEQVPQLQFYMVSPEQVVLYTFPKSVFGTLKLNKINAVSFKDMNGDGEKDIIVIGEYRDGNAADTAASSTSLASVYFYSWESFIVLPWYNDIINTPKGSQSVNTVVQANEKIRSQIHSGKAGNPENADVEIEQLASLICGKELLRTGDMDYAELSGSLVVFSNSTTFSESYIASLTADFFAKDSAQMLSGDQSLANRFNQYEQLLTKIENDIATFKYMESGGGTIWTILNSYSALNVQMALNQYAKGINLDDQANIHKAISVLAKNWDEQHEKIRAVIKDKGFGDEEYLMEFTEADFAEIVDLERRLEENMNDFMKLAAGDNKAKLFVDLIINELQMEI